MLAPRHKGPATSPRLCLPYMWPLHKGPLHNSPLIKWLTGGVGGQGGGVPVHLSFRGPWAGAAWCSGPAFFSGLPWWKSENTVWEVMEVKVTKQMGSSQMSCLCLGLFRRWIVDFFCRETHNICWSLGLSEPEGDSENLISRRLAFSVPNLFICVCFRVYADQLCQLTISL